MSKEEIVKNRWARPTLAGLLVIGLAISVSPTFSSADDLSDLKDKRSRVQKEIVSASKDISEDKKELSKADAALQESQTNLKQAQIKLSQIQQQLSKAKEEQAKIKAELKKAQVALKIAKEQAAQAAVDVDKQHDLIVSVALTEYQQRTDLADFGMAISAEDAQEISLRLQWADTIFNSTAAQMDVLRELEARSIALQQAQINAEAQVSAKNDAAKAQVAKIQKLANQAAAQKAQVQRLVAANKKVKAEAELELEQSKKEYKKLQAQEAALIKKINAASKNIKLVSNGDFAYPVNAKPGSPFGMRYHPILHYSRMHWGTDFGAPCGAPLYAMADGVVTSLLPTRSSNGLGNYTIISYGTYKGKSISSGYAHQSKFGVKVGQRVSKGQVVGYVGTTGLSTGCHLHLQIYYGGARVNPMQFL